MCQWGVERNCLVPIPAKCSHSGLATWEVKGVDICIAKLVDELNSSGRLTIGCCCGHNKSVGEILLQDGTVIKLN